MYKQQIRPDPVLSVGYHARGRSAAKVDLLAASPWLLVPYDSLTYLIGADLHSTAQTMPLTALWAVPYLTLKFHDLRSNAVSKQIRFYMFLAFILMMALTAIHVLIESNAPLQADTAIRRTAMLRQGTSMFLGIASLVMFQDSLLRLGLHRCMRYLLLGAIPYVVVAFVQMITGWGRVQGLSTEPAHMADFLIFAYLPACFTALKSRRGALMLAAPIGLILLLFAFSTTGMLKALLTLSTLFALRGQLLRGVLLTVLIFSVSYAFLQLFPDNYILYIFDYMWNAYIVTGQLVSGSFIDRFFGFVGPLGQLFTLHGWIGFGFGGDSVYFDLLFEPEVAAEIRSVKGDFVAISSLQGKMLMYGGVLGYFAYLLAWQKAFKSVPRHHIACVFLLAIFGASIFSLAPMFLPYVWMWLAIAGTATAARN